MSHSSREAQEKHESVASQKMVRELVEEDQAELLEKTKKNDLR